jgi:hypothetical protein
VRDQLPHFAAYDYERAAVAVRDSRLFGRWWFFNCAEYRDVIASALSVAASIAKQEEEMRAATRD